MFYNLSTGIFKPKMKEIIRLGRFLWHEIEKLLNEPFSDPGEKVVKISEIFLGLPYVANTLSSGDPKDEVFVINFEGLDCMTFIEYVEALRISFSFEEFREALRKVRYKNGVVSYYERKHFFTDWVYWNEGLIDFTSKLKEGSIRRSLKRLNVKEDGTYILSGIKPEEREISYLPADKVDLEVVERLSSGDYIGFYTSSKGLDCSHAGIIVKKLGQTYIRHASSIKGKVVDEEFLDYVKGKEGIIVLRPI
jgi:hypothetical protein